MDRDESREMKVPHTTPLIHTKSESAKVEEEDTYPTPCNATRDAGVHQVKNCVQTLQSDRQSCKQDLTLSCQRTPSTTQRNTTPCEVIDLTDSPPTAEAVCRNYSDCKDSLKDTSMTSEEQILNIIAEHISQESISSFIHGSGSANGSVLMASVLESLGKPLSSVMNDDVSFLKLDTGLAQFLQNLSSVSSMLSDTRNSVDLENDSVFGVDDDED